MRSVRVYICLSPPKSRIPAAATPAALIYYNFRSRNRRIMDTLEDTKVAERAIPTKFEKREWFLENLRSLLSLDLNQDPPDEDSRSECLRLHYMELTVSDCTCVRTRSILTVRPSLLCVDKQFPRTALPLGSVPRGNGTSYHRDGQESCQSPCRH